MRPRPLIRLYSRIRIYLIVQLCMFPVFIAHFFLNDTGGTYDLILFFAGTAAYFFTAKQGMAAGATAVMTNPQGLHPHEKR